MSRSHEAAELKPPPYLTQPDGLFRAAVDQAPQPMWIVNSKGAVTYLNHAWYELVGGMPPKWYGHEWGEVVEAQDLLEMREQWKSASLTGAIFEGMRRVRARDGAWHTLAYKATPVFDDQGLICWVGLDADITELTQAQAALRFANQELEAFSYTVSHDLRTPLVTLRGFVAMLAKLVGPLGQGKAAHYLDRIAQATDHMGRLIDGLLALSHVTRRKLQREDVDMSKLATDIAAMLQRREADRSVAIHIRPGLRVQADSRLMASMLENLLGNAWKFTAGTEKAEISIDALEQPGDEIVFYVRDNGPGFDMAHAAQLFGAFERLPSTSAAPGMGIGLATVSRIAARHGGRAWAEAEPGKGATFYIALPRA